MPILPKQTSYLFYSGEMTVKVDKKLLSIVLVGTIGLVGCSSSESGSSDDETPKEENKETLAVEDSANPEATAAAAALKEGTPSLLLNASTEAIQSSQIGTLAISTSANLVNDPDESNEGDGSGDGNDEGSKDDDQKQSPNDPLCSTHGDPWDTANNTVDNDSEDYPAHFFYCKVNSKVIESPETVSGALAQTRSILCSMEENLDITSESYTTEGKEHVVTAPYKLSLTETCWPQGLPGDGDEKITEAPMDSIVTTKMSSESGWQYQLIFKSAELQLEKTVRMFNSQGIFGFQLFDTGVAPGIGSDVRVTVDTNTGVLLYNEIVDRGKEEGSDDVFRSLTRVRVQGEMGADFKFSKLSSARGYASRSGPDFDGSSGQAHTYSVYTVDGNTDTGWQFKQFWTNQTPGTLEVRKSYCSDGDSTCSGSANFAEVTAMEGYFKGTEATRAEWATLAASGKPMCSPKDGSNADIEITATPKFQGPLGICAE
jgi:hypothetical protein